MSLDQFPHKLKMALLQYMVLESIVILIGRKWIECNGELVLTVTISLREINSFSWSTWGECFGGCLYEHWGITPLWPAEVSRYLVIRWMEVSWITWNLVLFINSAFLEHDWTFTILPGKTDTITIPYIMHANIATSTELQRASVF